MEQSNGMMSRLLSPAAGVFNRFRLGFPRRYFHGGGGIGDDLLCTAVFRELKKRSGGRIAMRTKYAGLFENNPDVDHVLYHSQPRMEQWISAGLPWVPLTYAKYDPFSDADVPPDKHILLHMLQLAGVRGPVEVRPYLFLSQEEFNAGKRAENQVVIQSSGLSAANSMRNKEWYPQRFQEVCAELRCDLTVIQLGSPRDPKLEGALDLRGQTTLRESAAILANSMVFIGLVGFMMHLARAVDCRSVILYGGREKPTQTGYVANKNLYNQVKCAPCWLRNPCEFDRKCMDMITPQLVVAAAAEQIAKYGTLLELQTAQL
ncbi:MAG TPA: glycosyltransferase family 9 protein [Verrucomicrobiae bacterium]